MKLVVSDLSNIEGRILALLAGEEWKLQAFRDYDGGVGPDLYNVTASGVLGQDPYSITKKDRNVFGKVPDLALGFEGGVGALQQFTVGYGVAMSDHWPTIQHSLAPGLTQQARDNFASWGSQKAADMQIGETEWVASESVKLAWRERHPATRALWYACKDAMSRAILQPGSVFLAGPLLQLGVVTRGAARWLLVKLPSGRYLTYIDPRVDGDGNVTYEGYGDDGKGARVWGRQYTYGGKMVENACQAVAGDVLKHAMPDIEAAGYEIVLTVHDEVVCQAPSTPNYNAAALSELLSVVPPWAPGLPLAAAGFEAYRYKKED